MKHSLHTVHLILFLGIVLSSVGCRKEIPELPAGNTPVFEATGTFDGEQVLLIAGDDEVSMTNDKNQLNGINQWVANLGNESTQLSFRLLDGQIGLPINTADIFKQMTEIQFAKQPATDLFYFSKDLFTNKEKIEKITWFVNNTFHSINVIALQTPGKYNVCAQVEFTNGEVKSICNTVIVGYKQNGDFQISYYQSQTGKINAWIGGVTQPIESIKWYRDNQLVGEQIELNSFVQAGDQLFTVEATFENGNVRRKNILIDGDLEGNFVHDFTYNYVNFTPSWDYKGIVEWNYQGETYSSLYANNTVNRFSITTIEQKIDANSGKSYYKVNGTLKANVAKNSTTPAKQLSLNVTLSIQLN